MSGKASLVKNLELLGIQLVEENLQKVLRRIVELGDSKKTITLADLPFIITDVLETHEEQRIELLNCSISSGLNLKSVASIRMMFDKKEHNESGSGNGGYDAFMSAVKKILKKHHLQCPQLLDYQIRIPRGGQTDALSLSLPAPENSFCIPVTCPRILRHLFFLLSTGCPLKALGRWFIFL